jgi:ABC-type sugar transport system ATPase subunit
MIEVREIGKHFGSRVALDRITFTVPARAAVVIAGPSGSGKTTLLRLIAGLEAPDQGVIRLGGRQVSAPAQLLEPYRRGIGFVFQSAALWPHMSVAGNIGFALGKMPKTEARQRIEELLVATGLDDLADQLPHQISGGEARRVAIARALAPQPRYLLLDEPLIHLEPELKQQMLELILGSVRQTGACMVYVTHDADEAAQVSSSVLSLDRGRLVSHGQAGACHGAAEGEAG